MLRLSERCRTALVWDPEACGKRSLCACFFDSETGRMKCCTPCELSSVLGLKLFHQRHIIYLTRGPLVSVSLTAGK